MSCGPSISLATKGIICCNSRIVKQLVTSLCLNINTLRTHLNLKINLRKINFKIKLQDN